MQLHDIADYWPLSNPVLGDAFQTYPTRQIFHLRADQGEFVAKVDFEQPMPEASRRALHIFEYLELRRFGHIPALLRTRNGDSFVDRPGQRISVMEYVAGQHPDLSTAEPWRELGKAAARLNSYVDYPFPFSIPVPEAIHELMNMAGNYPLGAQYLAVVSRLEVLKQQLRLGLIHGEINPANCVLRADGTPVLLDWDEAGTGPIVLELGYPLITVFLGEDLVFHREPAAAFYAGYNGETPIDEHTRRCVFSAALFHALRYMRFADVERRWHRIRHAIEHEALLLGVLP